MHAREAKFAQFACIFLFLFFLLAAASAGRSFAVSAPVQQAARPAERVITTFEKVSLASLKQVSILPTPRDSRANRQIAQRTALIAALFASLLLRATKRIARRVEIARRLEAFYAASSFINHPCLAPPFLLSE